MNAEQLQTIKEHFENVPQGWPVKEGGRIIGWLKEDGMALIAEVERLQNIIISERRESLIKTYESIGAEDVEIKRLREALGFYADEKNYNRVTLSILTAKVLLDNGELARQALEVNQ